MSPLWVTGANGLPVATRARPSVQASRSAGTASHIEVGLDSGRTTGRSTWAAMSLMMFSVNAPPWVEAPVSTVGWTWPTTSARLTGLFAGGDLGPRPWMAECRQVFVRIEPQHVSGRSFVFGLSRTPSDRRAAGAPAYRCSVPRPHH